MSYLKHNICHDPGLRHLPLVVDRLVFLDGSSRLLIAPHDAGRQLTPHVRSVMNQLLVRAMMLVSTRNNPIVTENPGRILFGQ